MNDLITFPTTPEAFIAYQENGINRKLDDLERKLADVVVGLVNGSYQEGIEGKENTVTIQLVRKFYKECNNSSFLYLMACPFSLLQDLYLYKKRPFIVC